MTDTREAHEQQLLEQALEWCVLLADIEASEQQRRDFARWLEQGEAQQQAWQRAQQVWGGVQPLVDHLATRPAQPTSNRKRWRFWACAASLVLGVVAWSLHDPAGRAGYQTGTAQVQSWQLEDGSRLSLDAGSAADIDYGPGQRRIRLYRGNAVFEVAADPQRPFIVESQGGTTQALGTVFALQTRDDQVRVLVSEHSVRVSRAGQQRVVPQGSALTYGEQGLGRSHPVDITSELAWLDQRLVFQNIPLDEVIQRLQPYLDSRLLLADGELGRQPVTAVFDSREPEKALQALSQILPLELYHLGPWLTLIRSR